MHRPRQPVPWYTSGVGGIGYELGGYKDQVNTRIRNGIGASGGPDALLDLAALCSDSDSGPSKYKLSSFTSSLTSLRPWGPTTLVMADKPDVDETFVIEPGTAMSSRFRRRTFRSRWSA